MEEIVRMMTELIHQGKVLYWGTSQWSAQQLSEAYGVARQYQLIPPTMEQPQYSMFHREKVELEFAPLYETMGLGTTIWSPLYFGILTGKYNDGIPADSRATLAGYEWVRQIIESEEGQQKIAKVRELTAIAEGLGTSMSRLAIAWCLRNPRVSTVIMGASRVEQVHDNLRALDLLPQLTDEVMAAIEGVLGNKPVEPEGD
jgi:aryl-alcohol dehydrogenase-like predicted oxidoreductase